MELNYDVWFFIVRFSNGKTRLNLSKLNKHFRNAITNIHIHFLTQETNRIQSFLIDVESTTTQRFTEDFEKLKLEWKPPHNDLLLNYVDYYYHLLYISLEMLFNIEAYHLFFYHTHGLIVEKNDNLVKILLACFKKGFDLEHINEAISYVSPDFRIDIESINKKYPFESVYFLHKETFHKWKFILAPFRSRHLMTLGNVKHNLKHQYHQYEIMMTRFFSLGEILRRSETFIYEGEFECQLHLPADHVKWVKTQHHLPHFNHKIPERLSLLYSPYIHSQITILVQNEMSDDSVDSILEALIPFQNQIETLSSLLYSQEFNYLKRIFPKNFLINVMDILLDSQKLKSIYHLMKNWPHVYILIDFFHYGRNAIRDTFQYLSIKVIDALGYHINSIQENKKNVDLRIETIIVQLNKLKYKTTNENQLIDFLNNPIFNENF